MAVVVTIVVAAAAAVATLSADAVPSGRPSCPDVCDCRYSRVNWVTDCSENGLTSVPHAGLDRRTYALIMNGNRLRNIGEPFPADVRLRTLQMSGNLLTGVGKTTFAGLRYLLDADLSYNSIGRVNPEAFADSAGLITLELQGNPLGRVDGPFLRSGSLRNLYLSKCHLTALHDRFFQNVRGLSVLDLSENPLGAIDAGVFRPLAGLTRLALNSCDLTHVAGAAFGSLGRLATLELAGNRLKSTVDWTPLLGGLARLERLDLTGSGVRDLPNDAFRNNAGLRELALAGNDLSGLDVAAALGRTSARLRRLDLGHCNLTAPLPDDSFANATDVRTLVLSGNDLSAAAPLAVSPLTKLATLTLSDCGLTRLPVLACAGLRELDVSRNPALNGAYAAGLSSPPESLERMDMGYSDLRVISGAAFSKMPSLETLILSGNHRLENVEPGAFRNLTRLKTLQLDGCGLGRLNGAAFGDGFARLEELNLAGNPLVVPDEGPMLPPQLSGLKNLDVGRCGLTLLPGDAFVATPNIGRLLLNDNRLTNAKDGRLNDSLRFLAGLVDLEQLDLSHNGLTYVAPDQFRHNRKLASLILVGNPWKCDCYLFDAWKWLVTARSNVTMLVGPTESTAIRVNKNFLARLT